MKLDQTVIHDALDNDETNPDDYDDNPILTSRPWQASDALTPPPPRGWIIMTRLHPKGTGIDTGVWICALWELEKEELARAQILHVLCRDPDNVRVLVLDPLLLEWATMMIEEFNGRITGCSCGGADCLAGEYQIKGLRVRAQRAWRAMTVPQRFRFLKESGCSWEGENPLEVGEAFDEEPAFLTDENVTIVLYEELIGAR
jgi:hypothetical protein